MISSSFSLTRREHGESAIYDITLQIARDSRFAARLKVASAVGDWAAAIAIDVKEFNETHTLQIVLTVGEMVVDIGHVVVDPSGDLYGIKNDLLASLTASLKKSVFALSKVSPSMLLMLDDVKAGLGTHGSAYGRGEHGGRHRTALSLRKRGLINTSNELTAAGKAALDKHPKFESPKRK